MLAPNLNIPENYRKSMNFHDWPLWLIISVAIATLILSILIAVILVAMSNYL